MGTSRDPKTLYLDFIPSVANTGPQALYVRYLLRKAREMAERAPFKIPEELIKLTVSFDADGNPVSSVDLAKHGLSMPVITPKPTANDRITFDKALQYMDFHPNQKILGHPVQYVFLGSCTNGRMEDFRAFTDFVKGRQKHPDVVAWLVPGSGTVARQIHAEGLDKILEEAGFALRQPGCSACLAMNEDKVPAGMYAVSTSNRNFEGRQGPGSRTLLASPLVAAAAAITGKITDPRNL
jgi:homoaconitase/3-isopropylmalate dehydratase large subunit